MLMAMDIGNTNIVAALLRDGEIVAIGRLPTYLPQDEDYWQELNELFTSEPDWAGDVNGAIISSVVPKLTGPLRRLCRDRLGVSPLVVGEPGIDVGIAIEIDDPAEVGSDRLVNAVAGWAKYGEPLIIIDFGTATTFDLVGAGGAYLGGVIAPGINLSLEALHKAAARLPGIDVKRPEGGSVVGKNTVEAMQSGIFWGYAGLIEGIVSRLRDENGPARVIATGGLAPLFADELSLIEAVEENLTIEGLAIVFERNTGEAGQ